MTENSPRKERKTFRKRPPHWVSLAILAVILIVGRFAQLHYNNGDDDPLPLAEETYQVERAVDGDTIIVIDQGERRRVRLIGIDTPEVFDKSGSGERLATPVPFGPEASNFTKDFISGGQVQLRFGRRRVDQYDRWLAYVFVNDRMLNEELARAGLAKAKTYAGDESPLSRRIETAEAEAQQARRGIWSLNAP